MISPMTNDVYFLDTALASPLLSGHEKNESDDIARCDIESAVIIVKNQCIEKDSTREEDRCATRLELLDFCMQLTLMISIIHRDFFIHQTYTFVILLMYAVALFWKNHSSPLLKNVDVVSQNDATGGDQAKDDAIKEGATVNLCCIWGDFFMEHAGYVALIVWDFLFLMEEGDNINLHGESFYLFQSEIALSVIIMVW
eukprot:CAMPEP_0171347386 /NCGR_PEP_ID=MMETSP0878-20121228/27702_1 /TAXON_ID=67004 /ORGANISM="Thalassiosira weissflogii, Strain CCMP1336" /LENGTH=197 /DNA_ID=CAMNT_0011851407 /DNA_START=417 /DNA_END=1007 /DNA_ORIENTATION=-